MGTRAHLVRGTAGIVAAIGAVLLFVVAAAASAQLGGSFRADLEASEIDSFALKGLTAVATLSGETWRTSARLVLADNEVTSLDVTDERTFGPLWTRSTCVFDPQIGFSYLGSTVRFTLLDLQLGNYAFLSRDPSLSYDQWTAKWTAGDVVLNGVWRTGLCPLTFQRAQVAGQWYVPSCNLSMDVRTAVSGANGFDYLLATARFARVPFLSNEVVETELRLALRFEVDRKEFIPTLRMRAGSLDACMTPYVRAIPGASPFALDGVEMYGWVVECALADDLELRIATSLDPASNRELTGEADYWEVLELRGVVPGCCGRELRWELLTYFEDPSAAMFDWGLTAVSAEVPLGDRLTARFGTEFRPSAPHWSVNAGLELRF